jgi:hypothetical protein
MTLPNFLIIGQMKAGTSSLHAYLRQHPQIFMPSIKEARFFNTRIDDPTRREWKQKGMPVTLEEYEQLFDSVTDEIAIGEASPQYLQSEHAPPQIKRTLPDVRLIVSLRRPADRLYSMYLMLNRIGREKRDFASAFHAGKASGGFASEMTCDGLKRYYDAFGASKLKAIKFEELIKRAQTTLEDVFEFLEVDRDIRPNTSDVFNEGGVWKSPILGRVTTGISGNLLLMQRLKRLVPSRMWNLAKRLQTANVAKAPALTPELRHEITAHFREDTLRVQNLVGLDLSDWLAD